LGDPYLEGQALLNLGAAALEAGDELHALARLEEARTRFERLGNDGYAALAAGLKAHAHLSLGEKARAESELSRRAVDKGASQLLAAQVEVELARGELALLLGDLHEAGRAVARVREALLTQPDLEGPWRAHLLAGKLKAQAGDQGGAQAEFSRAARLLDAVTQRVPAAFRQGFLSSPRRAELLKLAEPELKLPAPIAPDRTPALHGLIGASAALNEISRKLPPIGKSHATVLLRGESGTGKEVIAEALHKLSPRRDMPLVKVNCAAMVEELLLSELFGHEKGAFTGAVRERKGRFELADGGTLFLDEIGDISPRCQVALLRVLQEREFERVGGTRTLKIDVRVICATNRDLEQLIAQGRFRADLYYRLKGVMLELPPLRERLDDLPLLASHFLTRSAKERGEQPKRLGEPALELLRRHSWPGNVRELENVLAAAAIFAEGATVEPDAFSHVQELEALMLGAPLKAPSAPPAPLPSPVLVAPVAASPTPPAPLALGDGPLDYYQLAKARGISLKELRHEVEMQCIKRALIESHGNISEAARLLLMKRSRLSQIVNANAELKEVAHADE
jgi:transcriptional regulator with GAF, ATPase, and Fis domain